MLLDAVSLIALTIDFGFFVDQQSGRQPFVDDALAASMSVIPSFIKLPFGGEHTCGFYHWHPLPATT
jgi:hypothetical protein